VNPRPASSEIARYYPPDFYNFFSRDSEFQQRRYAVEARFLEGVPCTCKPRLLDIGCANGDFPRFMRQRGWLVEGVEVSPNSSPIDDFPVYRGEFPSLPHCGSRYDAITAWAVLEHVHDPMAHFVKAGELLRPGGRFVFLVTNLASIGSRYLYQEDVPRHLYFYTEAAVEKYLAHAGLTLHGVNYGNSIYRITPYGCLWLYLLRLTGRRPDWIFLDTARKQVQEWAHKRQEVRHALAAVLHHPGILLTALDLMVAPIIGQIEIWRRRYGIVTYVATKPR
jgi:SAM-dependent methyltransferase